MLGIVPWKMLGIAPKSEVAKTSLSSSIISQLFNWTCVVHNRILFPSFLLKGDGHGPRRHRWLCGWHLTSLIDGKVGATTIANANHQHLDCLEFHHLSHWCKKTMRLGWSPCKLGSNFTYCSISQYILQFTTVFLVFFIFFSFSFSSWETTKSRARESFSAKCESEEVMNVPTETASVCVLMWRLGLGWRSWSGEETGYWSSIHVSERMRQEYHRSVTMWLQNQSKIGASSHKPIRRR